MSFYIPSNIRSGLNPTGETERLKHYHSSTKANTPENFLTKFSYFLSFKRGKKKTKKKNKKISAYKKKIILHQKKSALKSGPLQRSALFTSMTELQAAKHQRKTAS